MNHSSASDWLKAWAVKQPGKAAIQQANNTLSYAELDAKVSSVAWALYERGVRSGDRVAYLVPTNYMSGLVFLALTRLNCVATPLNPLWRIPQVNAGLETAAIEWLIAPPLTLRQINVQPPTLPDSHKLPVNEIVEAGHYDGSLDVSPAVPSKPALLIFTSGSTGNPKAVMHHHSSLAAWTESTCQYLDINTTDRLLGVLSLAFGYGLNQLLCSLYAGATYIATSGQMVHDVLTSARDSQATVLATVPRLWREILAELERGQFSGSELALRCATNAGGHLSANDQKALAGHFTDTAFISMYGMTETLRSTYVPAEVFDRKAGSLGIAIPGATIELQNEQGQRCDVGEVGQILQSGPTLASGYFNASQATSERFREPPQWWNNTSPETRVCFSGDMAVRDDDGVFWFDSRADRQIKIMGFRFGPHEVEDIVCELPSVNDAALVTLKHNRQNRLTLAISARMDGLNEDELSQKITDYLRPKIASYMIPEKIHVLPTDLPKTANQKLDIPKLTELLSGSA